MNPAINYFFDSQRSVANTNCLAYFDFELGSNSSIIYNRSGDLTISGVVKAPGFIPNSFYYKNGSGYFTGGRYAQIYNLTGLNITDFTAAFIYEKANNGSFTLLSTVDTGIAIAYNQQGLPILNSYYKGYNFGVTANNKLFFEYYSQDGPNIFLSNDSLADKNSVYLQITNNNVAFGYFDFFKNKLVNTNQFIQTDYLFNTTGFFLGNNDLVKDTYALNKFFTGYMQEMLIFSPSILSHDLVYLNSGFAHIYNTGSIGVVEQYISGITGYSIGITGYLTGVTGYKIITGVSTINQWGVDCGSTTYFETGLTGYIPVVGISGISGLISTIITSGITGSGLFKNYPYIQTFGKNRINLLSTLNYQDDLIDINLITTISGISVEKNIPLVYEQYIQNYFGEFNLDSSVLNTGGAIVYANGQLQQSGSYYATGSVYNSGIYIINDYIVDDQSNFIFANSYNTSDVLFLDIITGYNTGLVKENFIITGSSPVTLTPTSVWVGSQTNIYFNGQKLTSGFHYTVDAPTNSIVFTPSTFTYSGVSGKLLGVPKISNISTTGSQNLFYLNNKFLYNFSEVYKNGIRQTLSQDYIEIATFDINGGTGFFEGKPDNIYNQDELNLIFNI